MNRKTKFFTRKRLIVPAIILALVVPAILAFDNLLLICRHSDTEWDFWYEETKEKQMFASGDELYRNVKIEGKRLCEELTNIRIDAIL